MKKDDNSLIKAAVWGGGGILLLLANMIFPSFFYQVCGIIFLLVGIMYLIHCLNNAKPKK